MKKILMMMILAIGLVSCSEKGDIEVAPHDFIEIHGKVYKLMSVVPCDGCQEIWIMYPKDSADAVPKIVNWTTREGKTNVKRTVIQVD